MIDPVVGSAGESSLFLSDLSMKQLRELREKLTGVSKDRESRSRLEAAVVEAIGKGGKGELTADEYVWCQAEGPYRVKRISLWICRERQRSDGKCPKSMSCDHKLTDVRFRRRVRTMAKEKEAKEPRVTKFGLLREAFAKKAQWTESELLAKTGYDKSNLKTATAILRDPERTKDPIYIKFDKESGTYSMGKMGEAPPKRERKAKAPDVE